MIITTINILYSRAMRYYYKRNELEIVRRKLIYKFGPRAAAWKMS